MVGIGASWRVLCRKSDASERECESLGDVRRFARFVRPRFMLAGACRAGAQGPARVRDLRVGDSHELTC